MQTHRRHITSIFACLLALVTVLGCEPDTLVFSPTTLPDAQVGSPYTATITVSQTRTPVGGAGIATGALPAGLDLQLSKNHDTIEISGTPTALGTFNFVVSVWCYGTSVSGQTGEQVYTIVVK